MVTDLLSPFFSSQDPEKSQKLSLQFLLSEIISAHRIMESCKEHMEPFSKEKAAFLIKKFDELLSYSTDNFFASKVGTLDKILYYIEILWNGTPQLERLSFFSSLKNLKNKIIIKKNLLIAVKKEQITLEEAAFSAEIVRMLDFAKALFKEVLENMTFFFEEFKEDENILFCLLKFRKDLSKILPSTFETLFRNLHSGNTMRKIIESGYKKRGFATFISKNEHLFNYEE